MILEIVLGLIIIMFSWTTFNLTRKVERLETWIEDYFTKNTRHQTSIRRN